jgi:hypothetical protein
VDIVGFTKGVMADVSSELRKWATGKTTIDAIPGKPNVPHVAGIAIFMVFIVIMGVMFNAQASGIKLGTQPAQESSGGGGHGKPVEFTGAGWTAQTGSEETGGDVSENSKGAVIPQQIGDKNLVEFTVTITWTDEPDQYPRHQNQPDELGIDVVAPWGENKSASAKNTYSASGGSGSASVSFTVAQYKFNGVNGTGDWNITPFAKECGDHMPKNAGLIKWNDVGNTFQLKIEWKFYTKATK